MNPFESDNIDMFKEAILAGHKVFYANLSKYGSLRIYMTKEECHRRWPNPEECIFHAKKIVVSDEE